MGVVQRAEGEGFILAGTSSYMPADVKSLFSEGVRLHEARPSKPHDPNPQDRQGLKREPRPENPGRDVKARKLFRGDGHEYVGGKYRDKKQNQAPGGRPAKRRNEQPKAAEDFREAADDDEGDRRRKKRRDDPLIKIRVAEVADARCNEQ